MVYDQPSICPREWDAQNPMGFWHANGSPNLGQTTRPYNNQQKKRTCKTVEIACPAHHSVKLKNGEKDKYLDLARKLKKLWNIKVTFIPIVIDVLSTVTERLLKGLEDLAIKGRVETIQISILLRSARILKRVLKTWGACQSNSSERPSANADVKNSQGVNNHNEMRTGRIMDFSVRA